MEEIIKLINNKYPTLKFIAGDDFVWSSANQTITYINSSKPEHIWALIHETAHGILNHSDYKFDHQLIALELEAWQEAKRIALTLNIHINQDHIENCLDTYRDWLHNRSVCPDCGVVGAQNSNRNYSCFNCQCNWSLPSSPLCRIAKKRLSVKII